MSCNYIQYNGRLCNEIRRNVYGNYCAYHSDLIRLITYRKRDGICKCNPTDTLNGFICENYTGGHPYCNVCYHMIYTLKPSLKNRNIRYEPYPKDDHIEPKKDGEICEKEDSNDVRAIQLLNKISRDMTIMMPCDEMQTTIKNIDENRKQCQDLMNARQILIDKLQVSLDRFRILINESHTSV